MPYSRRRLLLHTACLAAVRLTGSFALQAQMLSRPGWRGTNITPEAWWKHAAFVRLDAQTTFADAATAIPWMSDVGADSMVLPDLLPATETAPTTLPFAARFGTEDELDALVRETSARHMHVLLQAPVHRLVANQGEVRFWMNRGIAGFDVGTVGAADMDGLRQLRSALDKFPGQRILMARVTANGSAAADAAVANSAAGTRTKHGSAAGSAGISIGHDPVTLHIVSAADVESGKLSRSASTAPLLVEIVADATTPAAAAPSVDPAVLLPGSVPGLRSLLPLLLTSGTPIFDSGLLRTPEQRAAIQQVLALRNSHAALRNGTSAPLPTQTPSLRAWLISGRERTGKSSLLLAVNDGTVTATLQMSDAIKHAGIRGTYLRPILRSDGAMGSVNLESGQLPPGAAILAEIHGD
jgi:hypothetical protein